MQNLVSDIYCKDELIHYGDLNSGISKLSAIENFPHLGIGQIHSSSTIRRLTEEHSPPPMKAPSLFILSLIECDRKSTEFTLLWAWAETCISHQEGNLGGNPHLLFIGNTAVSSWQTQAQLLSEQATSPYRMYTSVLTLRYASINRKVHLPLFMPFDLK